MNLSRAAIAIAVAVAFWPNPRERRPDLVSSLEGRLLVARVYRAIDAATGDGDERLELRRICARESWCGGFGPVDLHTREGSSLALVGAKRWTRAVRLGRLDPEACPGHELGDPRRWSSRSYFGANPTGPVARAWAHGECVDPDEISSPEGAARFAADTLRSMKRNGRRTCRARARAWAGGGKFDRRSHVRRAFSVARQCGPRSPFEWFKAATLDLMGLPVRAALAVWRRVR